MHMQASMQPLRTPGIQAFLHTVPIVAALWFLYDVEPLTGPVLKGVVPSTLVAGLQARHQMPLSISTAVHAPMMHSKIIIQRGRPVCRLASCEQACSMVVRRMHADSGTRGLYRCYRYSLRCCTAT